MAGGKPSYRCGPNRNPNHCLNPGSNMKPSANHNANHNPGINTNHLLGGGWYLSCTCNDSPNRDRNPNPNRNHDPNPDPKPDPAHPNPTLPQCGLPPSQLFAFYDQIHTTGTDLKLFVRCNGAVTLGNRGG